MADGRWVEALRAALPEWVPLTPEAVVEYINELAYEREEQAPA